MRYLAFSLFMVSSTSMAATLLVPSEYSTIQAAINASINGDTVLVSPGTYNEIVNILGKAIVLTSAAGATSTTILSVIIEDTPLNNNTVLDGFTVCSNHSRTGIQCVNSNVIITGNNITQNWAYMIDSEGAGIQCNASSVSIQGNSISSNTGASGILLEGCSGLVANNEFIDNECGLPSWMHGGMGGALHILGMNDTQVVVMNNLFLENKCISYFGYPGADPGIGGAICVRYIEGTASVLIVNNTFSGNEAYYGGAVYAGSYTQVVNCILWDDELTPHYEPGEGYETYGLVVLSYSDVEQYTNPDYVSGGATIAGGMISDTPMFVTGTYSDFELDESLSPCIDNGNPASEYFDFEDPMNPGYALYPALGTILNDMGAYGGGGAGCWVGISDDPAPPGGGISMTVFPNPCSSSFHLIFELPEPRSVDLRVFDLSGRLIRNVVGGEMPAGLQTLAVDGSDLPRGIYLCILEAGEEVSVSILVLIR